MRWPTVALLLACWAVSSAADVVPTPTVTITQNSSDDSALTALQSENAALKARVAELEAKGKAFEAMYEDFKRQYVNGCPHCALDPNVNPNPTAATNQQLRNEIDDLINKERDRQRRLSQDEADLSSNGPKDITIFCPKPPMVKIVDLADSERDNNECLVLRVNAPDVTSRLVLYCDGSTSGTP